MRWRAGDYPLNPLLNRAAASPPWTLQSRPMHRHLTSRSLSWQPTKSGFEGKNPYVTPASHLSLRISIYEVAKSARSEYLENREEVLLTGILAWAFNTSHKLIQEALERIKPLEEGSGKRLTQYLAEPTEVEREVYAPSEEKKGRIDVKVKCAEFTLAMESKITRDSLSLGQIRKYHSSMARNGDYALIVLTPDNLSEVRRQLSGLRHGREKTYCLAWSDIWAAAEKVCKASERDVSELTVDQFVSREVMEAIEMNPMLKPFGGLSRNAAAALMNIEEASKSMGQLFRAVETLLTDKYGLGLVRGGSIPKRESGSWYFPVSIYDDYFDPRLPLPDGIPKNAVYFGPWIVLNEGRYSAYLETTPEGAIILEDGFKRLPKLEQEVKSAFQQRFPDFRIEDIGMVKTKMFRISAEIGFNHPLILKGEHSEDSKLPQLTHDIVRFYHDEVVLRILKNRAMKRD